MLDQFAHRLELLGQQGAAAVLRAELLDGLADDPACVVRGGEPHRGGDVDGDDAGRADGRLHPGQGVGEHLPAVAVRDEGEFGAPHAEEAE